MKVFSGPLFSVNNPAARLAVGDAEYIECIHTDIDTLGIGAAIGNADFYVNGGTNQPGCDCKFCGIFRRLSFI